MSLPVSLSVHDWSTLDEKQRDALLARPVAGDRAELGETVARIVSEVRAGGDSALLALTARFDKVMLDELRVTQAELDEAELAITPVQRAALERAIANVRRFHEAQRSTPLRVETSPGVVCERFETAISAVGIYVPAGSAPLPSAAIMSAVPAAIAGCELRVLCTPPR
ncbi:MAG: histidinol dehydrogenase, partial [Polyangia bacterium]